MEGRHRRERKGRRGMGGRGRGGSSGIKGVIWEGWVSVGRGCWDRGSGVGGRLRAGL